MIIVCCTAQCRSWPLTLHPVQRPSNLPPPSMGPSAKSSEVEGAHVVLKKEATDSASACTASLESTRGICTEGGQGDECERRRAQQAAKTPVTPKVVSWPGLGAFLTGGNRASRHCHKCTHRAVSSEDANRHHPAGSFAVAGVARALALQAVGPGECKSQHHVNIKHELAALLANSPQLTVARRHAARRQQL